MLSFHYYKKLLARILRYDQTYESIPLPLPGSALPPLKLIFRFVQLITALPLSLIAWILFQVLSTRYKISIYVLKTFRPGFGSTYLNMMEPLCRQLQYENNSRHIKILVEPGEAVSDVLVKSYEPHFTLYLDDRRKFLRLIAYLIPKSGLEKRFINTSDKFLASWLQPPSKNFVSPNNQIPFDLANLGIEKENFVLFTHASRKYYQNRFSSEQLSNIEHRFHDLSTYSLAIIRILENNLKVVRVGIDVDDLPPALQEFPIVDYTGEIRKEESELWLYENCKFLISSSNGSWWFAHRFKRPSILDSNFFLLGYYSTSHTVKLLKDIKSDELWTFSKTISHRFDSDFLENSFLSRHDIGYVPNSSQTILNSVQEMLNLDDPPSYDFQESDEKLIHCYKEILTEFQVPIVEKMSLPSISFLREFQHLLE